MSSNQIGIDTINEGGYDGEIVIRLTDGTKIRYMGYAKREAIAKCRRDYGITKRGGYYDFTDGSAFIGLKGMV